LPEFAKKAFKNAVMHEIGLRKFRGKKGSTGITCRNDMNNVRAHMINRKLTAQIPLTTDGERWVGYTFNNFSSGKLPMPNNTQWSHGVVRSVWTILTFVGDNGVQEAPVWEPDASVPSAGLPVCDADLGIFIEKDAVAFILYFSGWRERNSYGADLVLASGDPWQGTPLQTLADSDLDGNWTAKQYLKFMERNNNSRVMLSYGVEEAFQLHAERFLEDPVRTASKMVCKSIDQHTDQGAEIGDERNVPAAVIRTKIRLPADQRINH